ncbi:pyrroline-5-carboxylate reductase [Aureimonas altamirensis]|uniref:pyrroline-5-carboxylate reductase n=1 Tax=Aureimonas altamirensis TaxID=370622 RepID=UPI00255402CF|nr:pyrroline-5-carboxylate reductase [Aureimonas altamirensis]
MKIGFVGTGAITEAMVTGFLQAPSPHMRILLSPRSADRAARLAGRFPDQVTVAHDNQAVVDGSDIVVLAVRPQVAEQVISDLRFNAAQTVLSVVATLGQDTLSRLVAPATNVVRAVPLPAVAQGVGATAITPADPAIVTLFDRVGTAIAVDGEDAYAAMAAVTATMSTYFTFATTLAGWLAARGVPQDAARAYVAQILGGLARTLQATPASDFPHLSREHETPGGLNEQMRSTLERGGVFEQIGKGLDAILARHMGRGPSA